MTDEVETPEGTVAEAIAEEAAAGAKPGEAGKTIDAMLNVGLNVQIVLGRTRMPIAHLLKLSRGSIIELDKSIGQPVEVVINDRLVARGDLVKLPDDRLGVSLIEIVKDYVSEE
ncbi:FliM/FliN family flagellar motor switch protein [Salipiger sp. P9]|uniref:FliM/FliN family flagellar motor switch protein n=1 Tax=Salipiger pentaromativorans TaxID=2943193 RepID=UPI0021571D91|nr:FliM/FliN family flagellar motor switch protein [Salipiger pentaromativorans]MCR8550510.1 FliM/FliN family flagellar motor switch protein [Salipiger pentaromativorans]